MRGGPHGAIPYSTETRDTKGALKRLLRMLRTERLRVFGIAVLMLFAAGGSVLAPKFLGDATNVVVDGISGSGVDFSKLARVLLFVVGLYAVSGITNFRGLHYPLHGPGPGLQAPPRRTGQDRRAIPVMAG